MTHTRIHVWWARNRCSVTNQQHSHRFIYFQFCRHPLHCEMKVHTRSQNVGGIICKNVAEIAYLANFNYNFIYSFFVEFANISDGSLIERGRGGVFLRPGKRVISFFSPLSRFWSLISFLKQTKNLYFYVLGKIFSCMCPKMVVLSCPMHL